jgi:phosphoribosylformimino-5-aminoimidazole carboxamide ribotide isomerase
MRVIPVIDLMHGQVVRGIAGRRDQYRPIESRLAADAWPGTMGRALSAAGFRETYVADLDAIAGHAPAWQTHAELLDCGLELWIDAGVQSVEQASALEQFESGGRRVAAIVAGLESLPSGQAIADLVRAVGPDRLIFSLDMKAGRPLTADPAMSGLTPLQIATLALRFGVRNMIVLDLAAVGVGQGVPTAPLCRALRCLDPGLTIIAGGGVRGAHDLQMLKRAGCDAALVASALHDGRLDACEMAAAW